MIELDVLCVYPERLISRKAEFHIRGERNHLTPEIFRRLEWLGKGAATRVAGPSTAHGVVAERIPVMAQLGLRAMYAFAPMSKA